MWKRRTYKLPHKDGEKPATESLCCKAAAYCSVAEHCASEVRQKVLQWGGDDEQATLIIAYLIEENFLSEERYARAFVNDKIRYQKWGKRKVSMSLQQKEIDDDIIADALDDFPEEEYLSIIQKVATAKMQFLGSAASYEEERALQAKLLRHMASKGYTYAEISKAIKSIEIDE